MRALAFHKMRALFRLKLEERYEESLRIIDELEKKNRQLAFELLKKMYKVSEFEDFGTHARTVRVGLISALLAERIGRDPVDVATIRLAAPLHDIGKIGIPEQILLKPGKLSEEEFEIVKRHTEIGYQILSGSSSSILEMAARIALSHHEKWNGTGYPRKLKGKEIPWEGRVVIVADSFDAIVSERPYKEARPISEAFEEIRSYAGIWYDPQVVRAFVNLRERIQELYREDLWEGIA